MTVLEKYQEFCRRKGVEFQTASSVAPYDDTTLFCPAGMQQFKSRFSDPASTGTLANVQSCIRLNDLAEIGDGTHFLYFDMLGLFSFHDWTVAQTFKFWLEFLAELGIKPDYCTVHPDRQTDWATIYPSGLDVRLDEGCIWSDGEIGGYCTEFYHKGVEIGNIVNPLGTCIDVGFGLRRLEQAVGEAVEMSRVDVLKETALKILASGFKPSNVKGGYALRKILREIWKAGATLNHACFADEVKRQEAAVERYEKLKDKHADKSPEWWFDTHGIDLTLVQK